MGSIALFGFLIGVTTGLFLADVAWRFGAFRGRKAIERDARLHSAGHPERKD
jgi:hypothetical protein